MSRRKRAVRFAGNAVNQASGAAPQGPRHHYLRLALAVIGIAFVIALVLAFLRPPPPSTQDAPDIAAPPVIPSTEPTVKLPAAPEEIVTEELRKELQHLGEDLLARFPAVPEALHVVALLYADLQKTTEAEKIWQKCIKLDPQHLGPYIGLATAAMELGKDESAVETLQAAFEAGNSSTEAYHQLVAALTKLGRLEEAAEVSQRGLTAFPEAADNWFQRGQLLLQLGRFAEAETSLRQAIQEGYTEGDVYFALTTACARQGKQEEAAQHRQEFGRRKAELSADTKPFQTRYDAVLRRIAVASFCRAGTVYDRRGDPAKAEQLLLRALTLDPPNLTAGGELVALYRRSDRIADARLVQQHLAEVDSQNVWQFVNLASLSSQTGDWDVAEQALKQAVALRPDLALTHLALAQLYLQAYKPGPARQSAEAALGLPAILPEDSVRGYALLAEACRQQGDNAAAEAAIKMAERLGSLTQQAKPAEPAAP